MVATAAIIIADLTMIAIRIRNRKRESSGEKKNHAEQTHKEKKIKSIKG